MAIRNGAIAALVSLFTMDDRGSLAEAFAMAKQTRKLCFHRDKTSDSDYTTENIGFLETWNLGLRSILSLCACLY